LGSTKSGTATRLRAFEGLDPRYDVRNVLTRSGQTIRGRVFGDAAPGGAAIESVLESLFALRAQASHAVISYVAQPARLAVVVQGQRHRYTPDGAVGLVSGEEVAAEVKHRGRLHTADTLVWLTSVRRALWLGHVNLRVSTEVELDRPEENLRIRQVKTHRKTFHSRETDALDARFGAGQSLFFEEAVRRVGSRPALLHLIAVKRVCIDYRQPLGDRTVVSRIPGEANHEIELFHDW